MTHGEFLFHPQNPTGVCRGNHHRQDTVGVSLLICLPRHSCFVRVREYEGKGSWFGYALFFWTSDVLLKASAFLLNNKARTGRRPANILPFQGRNLDCRVRGRR